MKVFKRVFVKILTLSLVFSFFVTLFTHEVYAKYEYNAVLDFGEKDWTVYYPGSDSSMTKSAGKLAEGAKLYVIDEVINKYGNKISYVYSFDLNGYCYITSCYVKLLDYVIPEGIYSISPKVATGSCLDVADWNSNNEANLQIWTSLMVEENQQFIIKRTTDGYYTFESVFSGKMIDVQHGNIKSGTNIWLYEKNDTLSQKFKIVEVEEGYYLIESALDSNYVIDISGGNSADGTNVQLYRKNMTSSQLFSLNELTYTYNGNVFKVVKGFDEKYVYNQNDYTRFINDKGKNTGCTATSMATAYSIYNQETLYPNSSDIIWIKGKGVDWSTHSTSIKNTSGLNPEERFKVVYEYVVNEEIPVIIRLKKSADKGHSVTIVGVKMDVNCENLKTSDFLVIDPYGGEIMSLKDSMGSDYSIDSSWSLKIPK